MVSSCASLHPETVGFSTGGYSSLVSWQAGKLPSEIETSINFLQHRGYSIHESGYSVSSPLASQVTNFNLLIRLQNQEDDHPRDALHPSHVAPFMLKWPLAPPPIVKACWSTCANIPTKLGHIRQCHAPTSYSWPRLAE